MASLRSVHQGAIDEMPCEQSIVGHPNQGNPEAQPKRQGLGCQFILQWGSVDPIKPQKNCPLKRLSTRNFRVTPTIPIIPPFLPTQVNTNRKTAAGWCIPFPASIPVHRRSAETCSKTSFRWLSEISLRQNHTRFQNSKKTCPLEEFSLLFYHLWPTQRLQKSFFVLSAPSENAKCWTD